MSAARTAFVLALGATLGLPAVALAQQMGECRALAGTRRIENRYLGGANVTRASRPRLSCPGGRYIEADSAVSRQHSGVTHLMGNVYFQDASQALRADTAFYYESLGRLEADGDVTLTDRQTGNVLTGERLLYQRVMPGRNQESLDMQGGRPTATLYPAADTTAPIPEEPPDPYEVEADRISIQGPLFQATGNVELQRDSLEATAQRMIYDQEAGTIDFSGGSRVVRGRLDLEGEAIEMLLPAQQLQGVVATGDGHLVTDELDLEADTIRVFMTDGVLDRLVARAGAPPGEAPDSVDRRAVARAQQLVMRADSIDVIAPAEVLERVIAVGRARAVSSARDSLNTPETPALIRSDWIEGDTVTAYLSRDTTVAAGDSARYVLESLEAAVEARTLYRLDPERTQVEDETGEPQPLETPETADSLAAAGPPPAEAGAAPAARLPVSYVEADRIRIRFLRGTVDLMVVTGLRQGYYLTPAGSSRRATTPGGRP